MAKGFISGLDVYEEYNARVEEEEAMTPSRGPRKARGHPDFVDLSTMAYTHAYVYVHNDMESLRNMLERGKIMDRGFWNEKYLFPLTDANRQACAVMGIEFDSGNDMGMGFGGTG
tara:strand:- start:196 stop:540 length:345 start_codon:yes stop_codon:yes gene_type:complete